MTTTIILDHGSRQAFSSYDLSNQTTLTNLNMQNVAKLLKTTSAQNCGTSGQWIDANISADQYNYEGVYDVSVGVVFLKNAATWTSVLIGINMGLQFTPTGNSFTDIDTFGATNWVEMDTTNVAGNITLSIASYRVKCDPLATYTPYLKIKANYSAGTPQYYCYMRVNKIS